MGLSDGGIFFGEPHSGVTATVEVEHQPVGILMKGFQQSQKNNSSDAGREPSSFSQDL